MSILRTNLIYGYDPSAFGTYSLPVRLNEDEIEVDGFDFNFINRGNNASQAVLTLNSFDTVHYYTDSGSGDLYLRTGIEPNYVYELTYTCTGGASNVDFVLNPNGTTYANQFQNLYYGANSGATVGIFNQTLSTIYFDHYGGGSGSIPMGCLRFITYTDGTAARYQYRGHDNDSICFGTGAWVKGATNWTTVGTLTFNGSGKSCWIRRVA